MSGECPGPDDRPDSSARAGLERIPGGSYAKKISVCCNPPQPPAGWRVALRGACSGYLGRSAEPLDTPWAPCPAWSIWAKYPGYAPQPATRHPAERPSTRTARPGLGHEPRPTRNIPGGLHSGISLIFQRNIPEDSGVTSLDCASWCLVVAHLGRSRHHTGAIAGGRLARIKAGDGMTDSDYAERRSASSSSVSASRSEGPRGASARLSAFEIVPWRTPRRSAAACWVKSRRERQRASSAPVSGRRSTEGNRFGC